jgi:hypothetical protein
MISLSTPECLAYFALHSVALLPTTWQWLMPHGSRYLGDFSLDTERALYVYLLRQFGMQTGYGSDAESRLTATYRRLPIETLRETVSRNRNCSAYLRECNPIRQQEEKTSNTIEKGTIQQEIK